MEAETRASDQSIGEHSATPEAEYKEYKSEKTTTVSKQSVEYLGEGPLLKVLLYQTGNNATGYLIYCLYMLIDSIFIGKYLGNTGLSSSGLSTPLELLLCITVTQSFSVGTTTLVGPALGQNRIDQARDYATQFFLLAVIYCCIIPCIILPLRKQIASGMGAVGQTNDYLVDYLTYMFSGGVVAYAINIGLTPLMRQENKSRLTMFLMLTSSVLNLVLDAILFTQCIEQLGMKAAALSTMCSQIVIDIYILFAFFGGVKSMVLKLSWKFCRFTKEFLLVSFVQFIPACMTTVPIVVQQMFISSQFAKYGKSVQEVQDFQAAWGLMQRLLQLVVSPRLGIYFGFLAIMGYNIGQKKYERIAKLIYYTDWMTLAILVVVVVLLVGLMPYILMLFSNDSAFIQKATPWLRMGFSGTFSIGTILIASGCFQMQRKAVKATLIYLMKMLINVVLIAIFPLFADLQYLFLIPSITELISMLIAQVIIYYEYKHFMRLAREQQDAAPCGQAEVEIAAETA